MKHVKTLALLVLLISGNAAAHDAATHGDATHGDAGAPLAKVSENMSKALPDFPGKEILTITVDYPPGAVDPVHRQDILEDIGLRSVRAHQEDHSRGRW